MVPADNVDLVKANVNQNLEKLLKEKDEDIQRLTNGLCVCVAVLFASLVSLLW